MIDLTYPTIIDYGTRFVSKWHKPGMLIGKPVSPLASILASSYCQSCRSPPAPNATLCQMCGTPIAPRPGTNQPDFSATATPSGPPSPVIPPGRPREVVILTLLQALAGIVVVLLGLLSVLGARFSPNIAIFGIPIMMLGLIGLYIARGLYTGKYWARILAVIVAASFVVIGLIFLIVIAGIIPLALGVLALYYLTRPEVRSYCSTG